MRKSIIFKVGGIIMGIATTILSITLPNTPLFSNDYTWVWIIIACALYLIAIILYLLGWKWGKAESKQLVLNIPKIINEIHQTSKDITYKLVEQMPEVTLFGDKPKSFDVVEELWVLYTGSTTKQIADKANQSDNPLLTLQDEIKKGLKKTKNVMKEKGDNEIGKDLYAISERKLQYNSILSKDKTINKNVKLLKEAKKHYKVTVSLIKAITEYQKMSETYNTSLLIILSIIPVLDIFANNCNEEEKSVFLKEIISAHKLPKNMESDLDLALAKVSEEVNKITWN
jgi:NADH dehydrogenase/NADH:ubiquinone oxidoreductase subunit G